MKTYIDSIIHHIVDSKRAIFIILAIGTIFFIPFNFKVKPNNSAESMGVINDPAIKLMQRLEKVFGNEEFVTVSFSDPDIFSSKTLTLVYELTDEFKKIGNISQVLSLTEAMGLRVGDKNGEETLEITKLVNPAWIKTGVPKEEREKIRDWTGVRK